MANLLSTVTIEQIAQSLQTSTPSPSIAFRPTEAAHCYWQLCHDDNLHNSPENTGDIYWETNCTFLLLILAAEGEL